MNSRHVDLCYAMYRACKVNDRAQVKKTIVDITKGAYLFLAIGVMILAGIIFGIVKFLG